METLNKTITIPAPKFERYQKVRLKPEWSKKHQTFEILKVLYDFQSGEWIYMIDKDNYDYPEEAFED